METIIQRTLRLLLDAYGAQYDVVTVTEKSGHYTANIETEIPARLIGRNGSVINALQMLLKNILFHQSSERVFVTVDVDGYRAEKYNRLYDQVKKSIEMMREQNLGELTLRPMPPFQRRLAHLYIADTYPELTSEGIGDNDKRAVRIFYK